MKDVLFYYIRRNEKVKEFLAPFYKGYIYCKEYNRNKCYAIGAIKKLLEVDITQKRIWYFCVPTHSNLGDQAQACCIEKYFRKFFSDHIVFKLSNNAFDFYEEKILMILKEKIKETDLIFFQISMENMIIFIFLHGIKFRMIFINQFFLSIGTSIVFLI